MMEMIAMLAGLGNTPPLSAYATTEYAVLIPREKRPDVLRDMIPIVQGDSRLVVSEKEILVRVILARIDELKPFYTKPVFWVGVAALGFLAWKMREQSPGLGAHDRAKWGGDELTGKLTLRRVRLDSGGYASDGRYFGHGAPLWLAMDDSNGEVYVRARDRAAAKKLFPGHVFYR